MKDQSGRKKVRPDIYISVSPNILKVVFDKSYQSRTHPLFTTKVVYIENMEIVVYSQWQSRNLFPSSTIRYVFIPANFIIYCIKCFPLTSLWICPLCPIIVVNDGGRYYITWGVRPIVQKERLICVGNLLGTSWGIQRVL